jgi:hypothetical protein
MQTREIPRDQWREFLDQFSREHEGWQVTVEVLADRNGDQIITQEKPLLGISYSGEQGTNANISVIAGEQAADNVNHMVSSPSRLWVAQSDLGEPQGLQIESETDPTTLVTFRTPMSPEMYDRY